MFPPADNRITKYERIVLASIVAVATIVTAVAIVADQFKVNLLADLMRDRSDLPSTCNAKLGARFLFWAAFAYEIASIPVALHLKRQTPDVVAYQKLGTSGQHEHGRGSIRFKTAASIIVFAAITYWGSFHLAYGDSNICNSQYLVPVVVGYAQVFGVSVARGLLAFLFCHFYFMSLDTAPDRKSTE
jgi:hypothetical protein